MKENIFSYDYDELKEISKIYKEEECPGVWILVDFNELCNDVDYFEIYDLLRAQIVAEYLYCDLRLEYD